MLRSQYAVIQFVVDKEQAAFKFQALEFNNVPQMNLLAIDLMTKMCESANKNKK